MSLLEAVFVNHGIISSGGLVSSALLKFCCKNLFCSSRVLTYSLTTLVKWITETTQKTSDLINKFIKWKDEIKEQNALLDSETPALEKGPSLEKAKAEADEDMKEEVSAETTHLQERFKKLANIIK